MSEFPLELPTRTDVGTGGRDFKRWRSRLVANRPVTSPTGTRNAGPEREQKKDPAVARRVGKFWERMPERQNLYATHPVFVQVRNEKSSLQFLQFMGQIAEILEILGCFRRNQTGPFGSQLIAGTQRSHA
ncbi:hypothetical protein [Novosphingobium aromaticivorans]|uniref:hypothetical protein n=1 Tax=Novosphingobium aromaticivorans TaxID=48935 RepID=UPI00115FAACD|nr:hypothetical protein [Novosphingobium aromaticivorans]